jgi:PLP dependent protein
MSTVEEQIQKNYYRIKNNIVDFADKCGRSPDEVKLIVVTKGQPVENIKAVIESGAAILGENYPDEALEKIQKLKGFYNIQWQMIGHLQSRKIPIVVNEFKILQSLDRYSLAEKLSRLLLLNNKEMPVLIEINISGEESKSGFPGWEESYWPILGETIRQINLLPGINVCGLMTMPPFFENIEQSRPYFKKLKNLRDNLRNIEGLSDKMAELSMGTSYDYSVAIEEGATYVRVGRAIMGERNYLIN